MDMGKFFLVALSLALLLGGLGLERLWDLYERWRSQHTVSRELQEKHNRFNVLKENVKHVHKVNMLNKPYKLKLNKFADMTNHESTCGFMHEKADSTSLPSSVDWRKQGAVTGIRDQGKCGSCWAFSTVVAVEGINQIKTKKLVSLSEQELVDCDTENKGCDGGLMENAFQFIKQTGGVTTEKDYPYQARDGSCDSAKMNGPRVQIDGYESVPQNDENALRKAAANQPVSVAIDAGGKDFQISINLLRGNTVDPSLSIHIDAHGVYTGDCGKELNHGVAIVGYGTTLDGTKYWIVKNSWGPEWGEKGYLRIQCGLMQKRDIVV
ncbi:hypothetical protein CIPAW_05G177100 [Carya illinoinensis]|uniref:Uncharacterized protein n=1 Tax=Carya illinoinensis TaxID=32201 RepID=A0A8T1QKS0_CARIL|nr:hypothetical protein CIPAW_05G177100 [Carya illinoinensis]